ncbi:nickel ABC transporter permease [Paenibacillus sp. SYP-B4298]|uniref:nickel ABC transporter permease n=1 Tax=Paenibacillus sp. SYP-B4298 TaxID=2996034 RepID=UPI0022DE2905|nr:nickel ABC transporter permease [Paenibacillus sp. SYP-B4298]
MKRLFRRLVEFVLFILVLSFISFVVMKLAPGDAIRALLRADDVALDTAAIERQREAMGFNDPLWKQYGQWLGHVLQFDLGQSYMTRRPVTEELLSRLPATILLTGASLLVMLSVALPLGVASALRPNRPLDRISRVLAIAGTSIPSFWLGILLIELLSVQMGWLPSMGTGSARHLVLPALTLGLTMAAVYTRLLRASLLESLGQEFVRGARARGVSPVRIVLRHALSHALTPVLAMFGVSLGSLLGGTVVVEVLFAYPGMGKLVVDAIQSRDYPVIQGYMVVTALLITLCNLAVDGVQLWLNPEMRLRGGKR